MGSPTASRLSWPGTGSRFHESTAFRRARRKPSARPSSALAGRSEHPGALLARDIAAARRLTIPVSVPVAAGLYLLIDLFLLEANL